MKGSRFIFQVVFFLHLVSVIAGNDVITFNQEEFDEDNIETALETEHLIQVVDRHSDRPPHQVPAQNSVHHASPTSHSQEVFQLPLSNVRSSSFQNSSFSPREEIVMDPSNKHIFRSKPRSVEESWTSLAQWDDPSTSLGGGEFEDEPFETESTFFPSNGQSYETNHARARRALLADDGSGPFPAVNMQMVLSGSSVTSNAVQAALENYFKAYFNNSIDIDVSILSFLSGKVNAEVTINYYIERVELAKALHQLEVSGNFKVGNTIQRVSFAKLQALHNVTLLPVICFLCRPYQSCQQQGTNRVWVCRVADNRLYEYGSDQNDLTVQADSEFFTAKISLSPPITYDNELVYNVFISANGLISFGDSFSSFTPELCSVFRRQRRKILAPYWTDLDKLSYDNGEVYYHVYKKNSGSIPGAQRILDRANRDVLLYSGGRFYDARVVIVVTYSEMPPYPVRKSDSERVTFQCVIISNGETTYVIYLYAQGAMNFIPARRRAVEVCFKDSSLDNSRENYYVFDSVKGNTGELGHWFFLLGRVPSSRLKCLQWYESNIPLFNAIAFWNWIVPSCPCSEWAAWSSFLWIPSSLQPGCYDIFPVYGQFGRRCCYRMDRNFGFDSRYRIDRSFGFESRIPAAGNFQLYTPYYGLRASHEIHDAAPKRWCCSESNLCYLYYYARPASSCSFRTTWRSFSYGEPHMNSLDGRKFTFNGLGEFRLLEIYGETSDNKTVDFRMQGRTCRAQRSNGSLADGTVFCAIALQNTNKTSLNVEIHSSGSYMVIYANGQDYTVRFRNSTLDNFTGNIYLQKVNESLKVSTPDDIGITVRLVNNLLEFSVELGVKYMGMTKGLMGNFNADATDDFIFPNGTMLPNTSTERQLFEYGKTWAIKSNDSIFRYGPGENSSTFSYPDFEPFFIDEASSTELEEAQNICGGADNRFCIYDYLATQNEELALSTKDAASTFEKEEKIISNLPPVLNGTTKLYVTVNETVNLTITGSDPDNDTIRYILVSKPSSGVFTYTNSSSIFTATYMPTDISAVSIGVAAEDDLGLQSEVAEVTIVTCSGCNKHGSCNFDELRNTTNPYFSLASCDCEDPYTGEDCESDKDGCANLPCPQYTNCTDIRAEDEAIYNRSYNCSDCPTGFYLDINSTKCDDIDECASNSSLYPCDENANCTNTQGGFDCKCNHGYRKTSRGRCIDINECVENQHKCNQICINTVGSYDCSCYEGFKLDFTEFTCKPSVTDPCENLTHANCSYGCRNSSGVAQCFCETGWKLAADGYSCEDIDECQENLCSQNCNNTDGSYICSCFPGYQLSQDRLSCDFCSSNKHGLDCMQTCNCRGRATGCDKVKGCLCQANWTGIECEEDIDECLTLVDPCPKDHICVNTNGSFSCVCPTGYEEANGSCVNINECAFPNLHNCSHDCVDNPGSFACVCRDGYNANNKTCEDVDECALGTSGCEQNCKNMDGSFNCECHLGFILADDRKACVKDLNPCKDFNVTCSYACDIVEDSPQCYCQIGYKLAADNTTCTDINECDDGSHKCMITCLNTIGSYSCSCLDGMQLANDKRSCQACDDYHWGPDCVNECACNPKGTSKCDPVIGCICEAGWGGKTCSEDKNECSQNQTVCPALSNCVNTIGSFLCQCNGGFRLDSNKICSDIDECAEDVCDHNCNNTIGSYMCSCFSGFLAVGNKCNDIDECAVHSLSRCDQSCRNTQGGFACECYEGYILNTTNRNTCYRDPSAQTCGTAENCSEICSFENGQEICYCPPGYELSADNVTCQNINECQNNPCVNGSCTDLNGTFICTCDTGLKLATDEVTCQECNFWYYGPNCSSTCSCNMTNTKTCIATNGTCECYSGWNGPTCSDDVDECNGSTKYHCGENAECQNSPGSYRCVCDVGFFRTADEECIPCDATRYGQDCLNNCSCVMANTKDCNNTDGICTCKEGWKGSSCEEDIDECKESEDYCPNDFDSCINLNGSVECRCDTGYHQPSPEDVCQACDSTSYGQNCLNKCICIIANTQSCNKIDGTCTCKQGWKGSRCDEIATFKKYEVQITLMYSNDQIVAFGDIFNSSSEDFKRLADLVEQSLLAYGRGLNPFVYSGVKITNFTQGSVVASTTVYIDETNSTNPPGDAARLIHSLNTNKSLTINGTSVPIGNIAVGSESLPSSSSKCDILNQLRPCLFNETCVEESITCQAAKDKDKDEAQDSSKHALTIGLAVGIPLFIALTIAVAVLACLYVRRKRKSKQQSSSESVDHGAPFRNIFATRASTKGSWGVPHQMYTPSAYSETGTNESGNGGLLRGRQKGRSDFEDSAWYDNRGATPSVVPDSREASTEAAGPTSNFSWEYMFRLLEPHRDFEIQRPYYEPTPNPTFVARDKLPDSSA